MASIWDSLFYALLTAGFVLPFFILLGLNYPLTAAAIVGQLVLAANFAYGAFWAATVRKAIFVRLYRIQALWVLTAGAYFGIFWLLLASTAPLYPSYTPSSDIRALVDSYNDFGYTIIFVWIDATIRLARRSDPLMRSPLRWRSLRLVLWPMVLLGGIGVDVGSKVLSVLSNAQYPSLYGIFTTLPYISLLLGALVLGLSVGRSTDTPLRRHVRWFGLSMVLIIFVFLIGHFAHTLQLFPASGAFYLAAVQYTLNIAAGFLLFRSAKNLAPLNRVTREKS